MVSGRSAGTTLLGLFRRGSINPSATSQLVSARLALPKYRLHIVPQQRQYGKLSIPEEAWDSHMHVCDPSRFPLAPSATYKPHAALLTDALANADRLNLPNLVFVQPSTYANDNSCLLDALEELGPKRARGVVAFDPVATTYETLHAWHELGVRGVRINIKSGGGVVSAEQLGRRVSAYHKALASFPTWVVDLYIDLAVVPVLERVMDGLGGRKVVVAHFGAPPEVRADMEELKGWNDLVRMLRKRMDFYVKVSRPYQFVEREGYHGLEYVVKELLEAASAGRGNDGLVFASDWPHTRFEGVDVKPFMDMCLDWCDGDQGVADALFRGSAEGLWGVE